MLNKHKTLFFSQFEQNCHFSKLKRQKMAEDVQFYRSCQALMNLREEKVLQSFQPHDVFQDTEPGLNEVKILQCTLLTAFSDLRVHKKKNFQVYSGFYINFKCVPVKGDSPVISEVKSLSRLG